MKIKPIDAAGGVVFRVNENDSTEVLLIYRNSIWDIPKGKKEKGESNKECARREVMEEVNASELPEIRDTLVTTFHTYKTKKKEYHKTTYWYSMEFKTEQEFKPQIEEGITKVEWVELSEAITKVGFSNLKEVLIDFQEKYKA